MFVVVVAMVVLSFAALLTLDAMTATAVVLKPSPASSSSTIAAAAAVAAVAAGTMGKEAQSLMPQRFSPLLIQKCPSMPHSTTVHVFSFIRHEGREDKIEQ
jgi:hypothetical protein